VDNEQTKPRDDDPEHPLDENSFDLEDEELVDEPTAPSVLDRLFPPRYSRDQGDALPWALVRGVTGLVWMLWFEVKRACLQLWRAAKSYRAASWETVSGNIESVNVSAKHAGIWEGIGTDLADAELSYSYVCHGEMYGGCFQKVFYDEQRAWDFADRWKGRQVAVRRHPRRPDVSMLRMEDQIGGGAL
jgi:hypothetical protein